MGLVRSCSKLSHPTGNLKTFLAKGTPCKMVSERLGPLARTCRFENRLFMNADCGFHDGMTPHLGSVEK